jgi:hypothetical protein
MVNVMKHCNVNGSMVRKKAFYVIGYEERKSIDWDRKGLLDCFDNCNTKGK